MKMYHQTTKQIIKFINMQNRQSPKINPKKLMSKLIDRVGGQQKLALIVAQFYQHALSDDRFNSFWLQNVSDIPKLHDTVTYYLVGKFGGPNKYKGPDMLSLHKNMAIKEWHFQLYWEYLSKSLREYEVPESVIEEVKEVILQDKKNIVNTVG